MRWPFFRRWTPGRVVDLFRGYVPPEGVAVTVTYAPGIEDVVILAGRPGFGGVEALPAKTCVCRACLERQDYRGWATRVMEAIAAEFPADDVAFRLPSRVEAN